MSFEQSELLKLSPVGIVVCDADQRITWCNPRFLDETQLNSNDLVGHLYASLPIEAIDKYTHIVQLFDTASKHPKRFTYWQSPLTEPAGSIAHYFVLERDMKRKNVQVDGAKLPKRANWVEFLDYEVSRSRRYDNPLSILKLHILVNHKPETVQDDSIRQTIKDTLMDELRWADMIGNTSQGSYLMVLPETPSNALEHLIEKLRSAILSQLKYLSADIDCHIVFGSAYWQKHDDSQKMLKRARGKLVEDLEKYSEKTKG